MLSFSPAMAAKKKERISFPFQFPCDKFPFPREKYNSPARTLLIRKMNLSLVGGYSKFFPIFYELINHTYLWYQVLMQSILKLFSVVQHPDPWKFNFQRMSKIGDADAWTSQLYHGFGGFLLD